MTFFSITAPGKNVANVAPPDPVPVPVIPYWLCGVMFSRKTKPRCGAPSGGVALGRVVLPGVNRVVVLEADLLGPVYVGEGPPPAPPWGPADVREQVVADQDAPRRLAREVGVRALDVDSGSRATDHVL